MGGPPHFFGPKSYFFGYLERHAKIQNRRQTPSGRKVRKGWPLCSYKYEQVLVSSEAAMNSVVLYDNALCACLFVCFSLSALLYVDLFKGGESRLFRMPLCCLYVIL